MGTIDSSGSGTLPVNNRGISFAFHTCIIRFYATPAGVVLDIYLIRASFDRRIQLMRTG
jgi:hypothetical protein